MLDTPIKKSRLRSTKPAKSGQTKPSTLKPDDACLAAVVEALTARPVPVRNARLSLFMAIDALPAEDLAIIATFLQPFLSPAEIAVLCDVRRRSVYRWKRYEQFKAWSDDLGRAARPDAAVLDESEL